MERQKTYHLSHNLCPGEYLFASSQVPEVNLNEQGGLI